MKGKKRCNNECYSMVMMDVLSNEITDIIITESCMLLLYSFVASMFIIFYLFSTIFHDNTDDVRMK